MMKTKQFVAGTLISLSLAACADQSTSVPTPASQAATAAPVAPFALKGTVNILQRIALPKESVLTVTLSDAANAQGSTKVLAQQVIRLEGKQAPFHYTLPLNDVKLTADSQAFLSAAVTLDGQVIFAAKSLQPVKSVTEQQQDITLIPTPQVAVPVVAK